MSDPKDQETIHSSDTNLVWVDRLLERYPILPEDAVVNRASGDYECETCGLPFRKHPHYVYPSGMGSVAKGCDGIYYHL